MNYRTTLALVAATALTACDEQGRQIVTAALSALGATDPVGAAAAPPAPLAFAALSATPPASEPAPEPPPPPPPVYEYDLYNADPTGYVCTAVFRYLSCLDDGRPVYLDSQMAQLPFGTHQ
jgi:hypothetical protein